MSTSRRMVYPYTFTAKAMQFPFKYYYNNNLFFKSYIIAIVLGFPIFYKIEKLVNSPVNIEKAEKRKRKEHEEHLEHLKHLI